jgi:hypothetical protein
MTILRVTGKLQRHLPTSPEPQGRSDTALGDWYANRLVIDRQPLLLLVSAPSLLPLVVRAKNVSALPSRLPDLVADRLRRLGVAPDLVQAEASAMPPVTVAKTVDRSVVGILVDFAKAMPYLASRCDDMGLWEVESRLAETPCYAGRHRDEVIIPERKAPQLLVTRWAPH